MMSVSRRDVLSTIAGALPLVMLGGCTPGPQKAKKATKYRGIVSFSFPAYPTGEGARDLDMAAYGLVKMFGKDEPRSEAMPPWQPKEALYTVAEFHQQLAAATAGQ